MRKIYWATAASPSQVRRRLYMLSLSNLYLNYHYSRLIHQYPSVNFACSTAFTSARGHYPDW